MVSIPPPPQGWQTVLSGMRFTLVFLDGSGGRVEKVLEEGELSALINSRKMPGSPILAFPWTPRVEAGILRPAGGFTSVGEQAVLSWQEGPLAAICLRLWEAGFDPGRFNIERLGKKLAEREDPWEWDITRMAQKIAEGGFSAYDVDPLPFKEMAVGLLPGDWVSESPFKPVIHSSGQLQEMDLVRGMHAFFGQGGLRVDVYAD